MTPDILGQALQKPAWPQNETEAVVFPYPATMAFTSPVCQLCTHLVSVSDFFRQHLHLPREAAHTWNRFYLKVMLISVSWFLLLLSCFVRGARFQNLLCVVWDGISGGIFSISGMLLASEHVCVASPSCHDAGVSWKAGLGFLRWAQILCCFIRRQPSEVRCPDTNM